MTSNLRAPLHLAGSPAIPERPQLPSPIKDIYTQVRSDIQNDVLSDIVRQTVSGATPVTDDQKKELIELAILSNSPLTLNHFAKNGWGEFLDLNHLSTAIDKQAPLLSSFEKEKMASRVLQIYTIRNPDRHSVPNALWLSFYENALAKGFGNLAASLLDRVPLADAVHALNDEQHAKSILEQDFPTALYEKLLAKGLDTSWFNQPDAHGNTLIHKLARRGEVQLVQALVKSIGEDQVVLHRKFDRAELDRCISGKGEKMLKERGPALFRHPKLLLGQIGCETLIQLPNQRVERFPGVKAQDAELIATAPSHALVKPITLPKPGAHKPPLKKPHQDNSSSTSAKFGDATTASFSTGKTSLQAGTSLFHLTTDSAEELTSLGAPIPGAATAGIPTTLQGSQEATSSAINHSEEITSTVNFSVQGAAQVTTLAFNHPQEAASTLDYATRSPTQETTLTLLNHPDEVTSTIQFGRNRAQDATSTVQFLQQQTAAAASLSSNLANTTTASDHSTPPPRRAPAQAAQGKNSNANHVPPAPKAPQPQKSAPNGNSDATTIEFEHLRFNPSSLLDHAATTFSQGFQGIRSFADESSASTTVQFDQGSEYLRSARAPVFDAFSQGYQGLKSKAEKIPGHARTALNHGLQSLQSKVNDVSASTTANAPSAANHATEFAENSSLHTAHLGAQMNEALAQGTAASADQTTAFSQTFPAEALRFGAQTKDAFAQGFQGTTTAAQQTARFGGQTKDAFTQGFQGTTSAAQQIADFFQTTSARTARFGAQTKEAFTQGFQGTTSAAQQTADFFQTTSARTARFGAQTKEAFTQGFHGIKNSAGQTTLLTQDSPEATTATANSGFQGIRSATGQTTVLTQDAPEATTASANSGFQGIRSATGQTTVLTQDAPEATTTTANSGFQGIQSAADHTTVLTQDAPGTTTASASNGFNGLRSSLGQIKASPARTTATIDNFETSLEEAMTSIPEQTTGGAQVFQNQTAGSTSGVWKEKNGGDEAFPFNQLSSVPPRRTPLNLIIQGGHALFQIQDPATQEMHSLGFYPNRGLTLPELLLSQNVPCEIKKESTFTKLAEERLEPRVDLLLTGKQAKQMIQFIKDTKEQCRLGGKSYSLISGNCIDFIQELFQEVGFSGHFGRLFQPAQLTRNFGIPKMTSLAIQYATLRSHGLTTALAGNTFTKIVDADHALYNTTGRTTGEIVGAVASAYLTYKIAHKICDYIKTAFTSRTCPPETARELREAIDGLERKMNRHETMIENYFQAVNGLVIDEEREIDLSELRELQQAVRQLSFQWIDLLAEFEEIQATARSRLTIRSKDKSEEMIDRAADLERKFDTFLAILGQLQERLGDSLN